MMEVPYERQTFDHPNPVARFAHRARFTRSKEIALSLIAADGVVVDYGCGQGRFLNELSSALTTMHPRVVPQLFGYDPYMAAKFDGYEVVADPNEITAESVQLLTCLETCEHLDEAEMRAFVEFAREKVSPGGTVLITVPIMIGPAIILKEMSRAILFRRRPDVRFKDLLLAAFFGVVPPRAKDIKGSHRGYDWRRTYRDIGAVFRAESLEFSPFPLIGWYGNSQALMVFKKPL
jgi:SAM-dependent methyltransferase